VYANAVGGGRTVSFGTVPKTFVFGTRVLVRDPVEQFWGHLKKGKFTYAKARVSVHRVTGPNPSEEVVSVRQSSAAQRPCISRRCLFCVT
jgi:hypothetical protein